MSDSLFALPPSGTERLALRPLGPDDVAAFREITDDPEITAAVPFLSWPFTEDDARGLIALRATGRDCFLGAWRRDGGRLVGVVGTHLRDADAIEVGYWIASRQAGRGYATEAVGAVVALLRAAFPARRVVAECAPENRASWRVLEKLGFRPSGAAARRPGRRLLAYDALGRPE